MRLLVGDRGRPHSRQLEKLTDVLLGLLDARMPFPADPQGRLEDRDRRGDGGRIASSTSASGSRVKMATIADASTNMTRSR
jgi:hypothetical protein